MHKTDHDRGDEALVRAERGLAALLGVLVALLAVFALGASGIPGEAFIALIDWVVSSGFVSAEAASLHATVVGVVG